MTEAADSDRFPPLTLVAAVVLATIETAAELVVVAWRDGFTVSVRVMLMAAVALKLVFARAALRRRAAGVFALLLFELSAVLAALGSSGPAWARVGLAAMAIAATALLLASAHAFPSPELRVGP